VKRLIVAMAAFVGLGILAMFALKTWVRRKDDLHPDKGDVET
jgi:hypothetical protein